MALVARSKRLALSIVAGLALALVIEAQPGPGTITTVAGVGRYGFSGDGGPAASGQIDSVYSLAADLNGNLYIADGRNHRVRRVGPDGVIVTVAGTGEEGFSGDDGRAVNAKISHPRGLAVDSSGNLYISDSGNSRVRRVSPDGRITTVAGSGSPGYSGDGGAARSAQLNYPRGLAADPKGNLYIADTWNYRIRKVAADGLITTVAGNGVCGAGGNEGLATGAELGPVHGLALDSSGNLFLSDPYHHVVRKISLEGRISLYTGNGIPGFDGDGGPAVRAMLCYPRGIAIDADGNLFLADSLNHRVRKVDPSGLISTIAGSDQPGYAGDEGPAEGAQFNNPYDVIVDALGKLVISDLWNYRVRQTLLQAPAERPSLSPDAVSNAASGSPEVAPGSLITIRGSNLSSRVYSAMWFPLSRNLGGTVVTVGGQPIPLLMVSPEQINGQLPWGTPAGTARIKVIRAGLESDISSFVVRAVAPGLFTWGTGRTIAPSHYPPQDIPEDPGPDFNRGIVLNRDFTLNSPQNPAARGDLIVIYGTGQGAVTPSVSDGAASPALPLSRTRVLPEVKIGDLPAPVRLSCLAPDFVGLWQINVTIPPDAPVGNDVPVAVSIAGVFSNTILIAVR